MSTPPIRTALVGYGSAGRTIHGPLLAATDGLVVSDIVTANPERSAAAREAHPGVAVHPSYEALLQATRPDLVVIASPNAAHVPQAMEAVGRGIPVVVDKPLAVHLSDARELVDAAEDAGARLTVFQNRRWDTEHRTLRRLLADGVLGKVLRNEMRYERWRPVPKKRWREQLPSAEGGGLLLDLQSHLVDGALNLFGPGETVYAELAAETTVGDDVTFLALRHRSGVVSHLGATTLAGAPGPALRILGRDAAYVVGGLAGEAGNPWAGGQTGQTGWLVRGEERTPVPGEPGGWEPYYPAVLRWLRGEAPAPVEPRDAVAVLEVLEAARRSAAYGEVVTLR